MDRRDGIKDRPARHIASLVEKHSISNDRAYSSMQNGTHDTKDNAAANLEGGRVGTWIRFKWHKFCVRQMNTSVDLNLSTCAEQNDQRSDHPKGKEGLARRTVDCYSESKVPELTSKLAVEKERMLWTRFSQSS